MKSLDLQGFQSKTRQQLADAIDAEIAERVKAHQARVRFQAAAPGIAPLYLLSHGDSWFDYPLVDDDIATYGTHTDVIARLQTKVGSPNPVILNVAHHGDATTDELTWQKQKRMRDQLADPANWPNNGKPDAILFSGGGNDIAGDHFVIYLRQAAGAPQALAADRFDLVLDGIKASYLDLFEFRDRYAPGVRIFGHCYDYAIPNGVALPCIGPWLKPSFDYCDYLNLATNTSIVQVALVAFRRMLTDLAATAAYKFILIDTQGTLQAGEWANELHPTELGFNKIANVFRGALLSRFPGRI